MKMVEQIDGHEGGKTTGFVLIPNDSYKWFLLLDSSCLSHIRQPPWSTPAQLAGASLANSWATITGYAFMVDFVSFSF